jgi:hypothetical protein
VETIEFRGLIFVRKPNGNLVLKKKYKNHKLYSVNKETYEQAKVRSNRKCEDCGTMERLTIHHIDGNHENHMVNNLKVLCWPCHMTYRWNRKVISLGG